MIEAIRVLDSRIVDQVNKTSNHFDLKIPVHRQRFKDKIQRDETLLEGSP